MTPGSTSEAVLYKIAKAMAERTNGGDFDDPKHYADSHKELWLLRARIALEQLKDPLGALLVQSWTDAAKAQGRFGRYHGFNTQDAFPLIVEEILDGFIADKRAPAD